jgi:hypothetical protein
MNAPSGRSRGGAVAGHLSASRGWTLNLDTHLICISSASHRTRGDFAAHFFSETVRIRSPDCGHFGYSESVTPQATFRHRETLAHRNTETENLVDFLSHFWIRLASRLQPVKIGRRDILDSSGKADSTSHYTSAIADQIPRLE